MTKKKHILPCPTVKRIEAACKKHDDSPDNKLIEAALTLLSKENTDNSHVLLKVVAINTLMSVRVQNDHVKPLARLIAATESKIDSLLAEDSLCAVERIANCTCHGVEKMSHYSFATKYCSWHKPDVYPIHDGNVVACLLHYNNGIAIAPKCRHPFFVERFTQPELRDYQKFKDVMSAFRKFYRLDSLCIRQIDHFLWAEGNKIIQELNAAAKLRKAIKKAAAKQRKVNP